MKILITNIASVTAINIIKILRKGKISNLCIWGTETQEYGYNSGSILVDHYIQVPNVVEDSYVQHIKKICQFHDIDTLIPILDEELYLFAKAKMNNYVKIALPDINTINLFRDKMQASIEISKMDPLIVPQIYYNCSSVSSDSVIIRKKVSIGSQGVAVKPKTLLSPQDFDNPAFFVQEYIEGSEYTVDVLCDNNGDVKVIIPRKRLQIKNGISTKAQIAKDDRMIELCEKIYTNYFIPGLSNVQFIKHNNDIFFIELNMRFAGMGIASILSSYDFFSDYLLHLTSYDSLGNYSDNMKKVQWGSVICRYYEETIFCD